MKPYAEFCQHYGLDQGTTDARDQYRAYCRNLEHLTAITAPADPCKLAADYLEARSRWAAAFERGGDDVERLEGEMLGRADELAETIIKECKP